MLHRYNNFYDVFDPPGFELQANGAHGGQVGPFFGHRPVSSAPGARGEGGEREERRDAVAVCFHPCRRMNLSGEAVGLTTVRRRRVAEPKRGERYEGRELLGAPRLSCLSLKSGCVPSMYITLVGAAVEPEVGECGEVAQLS